MSYVLFEHKGKSYRLAVVRTPQGVWVGWRGGARFFGHERSEAGAGVPGHEEIRAPMTGKIVKVQVAAGDAVAENDVVVILEAMKMEYRLTVPRAGTVEAVHCCEGELVDLGKTLVSLVDQPDPAPSESTQ